MTVSKKGQWEVLDFTPLADLVERSDNALEALGLFEPEFGNTTTVEVERVTVGHDLIEDKARGGERNYADVDSAQSERLYVPFFPLDGYVKPNDVQDFRQYGEADAPATVTRKVERKVARIRNSHDKLRRTAMYECLKGNTYAPASAGSKYDVNFATLWGVTGDVFTGGIDFTDATADPALYVEKNCREHIIGLASDNASSYRVVCLAGSGFFNSIVNHPITQNAYSSYESSQEPLRNRLAGDNGNAIGRVFDHKGVIYIEDVSGEIARDDAYVFPLDIMDMFKTHYAPADTIEDANEVAEEMYIFLVEERRAATIETETSFVCSNTRPELVCLLTANTLLPDA